MAQGQLTAEEAKHCNDALSELIDAVPKTKKFNFFGHVNDISIFFQAAVKASLLLDTIRQYFLDADANSPFAKKIDQLVPRAATGKETEAAKKSIEEIITPKKKGK